MVHKYSKMLEILSDFTSMKESRMSRVRKSQQKMLTIVDEIFGTLEKKNRFGKVIPPQKIFYA